MLVGAMVRISGCAFRLTVAPPLMTAAVPAVMPVPLAFKLVLLLKLKVPMADTSLVAPAAMLREAELLMEPLTPNVSVPALMMVLPM